MCRHSFYMSNIYETTIIVKPDLANDQMKNLNTSIEQFFSDNEISIGYKEDWGIKNLKFSINKYCQFVLLETQITFLGMPDCNMKPNTRNNRTRMQFIRS